MGIPNYSADYETQYNWVQVGTLTAENAVLGVDGRDNLAVKNIAAANKVIYLPDIGTAAFVVRFRTNGSNDNAFVVHMYAEKGDDYYTRAVNLACIQGTQDWSSGHFVDSIIASNETWLPGLKVELTANEIGRVHVNTAGYSKFLFISPDCLDDDITTVYIDIARADQMVRSDVVDAIVNMTGSTDLGALETDIEATNTALGTIETDIEATNTALGTIETAIEAVETDVEATNTALGTIEIDIETLSNSGAIDRQSTAGGTEKLTLTTGTGTGAAQVCRECFVKPDPANTSPVNINLSTEADANDGPLDNRWMKVPVSNTNVLNFYSADADAVVYLMWRN